MIGLSASAILRISIVALAGLCAGTASAGVIYSFDVDTSSVQGTAGFLDFQFNPGNATSQAVTAVIHDFRGGTLTGAPFTTGDVAGVLPADVTFGNTTALNEYFAGFTYGAFFRFQLTLSGPAIDSPDGTATAGTTFGLGLYDSGQNPILTDQGAATGFAGKVDIQLDGSTQLTQYPTGSGPSVVGAEVVPEPASMALIGLGVAGLIAIRRRAR